MLQFINDLPENVVGLRATGEVTREDIDSVLLPRLDDLVKRQGEINYMLVLQTPVQKWTMGAWYSDLKAGLVNFTKWNKIAIVTNQKLVDKFTDIFSFTIPGESKGFELSELDEAVKWVSEK